MAIQRIEKEIDLAGASLNPYVVDNAANQIIQATKDVNLMADGVFDIVITLKNVYAGTDYSVLRKFNRSVNC